MLNGKATTILLIVELREKAIVIRFVYFCNKTQEERLL